MNNQMKRFKLDAYLDGKEARFERKIFLESPDFYVKEFYRENLLELVVISDRPFTEKRYRKSHLVKIKKDKLILEYMKNNHEKLKLTKDELINDLMNITLDNYYTDIHNNQNFKKLTPDFKVHNYCQGKFFNVLISGKIDSSVNKEYLTNIYFSMPMNVTLEDENGVIIADLTEIVDKYSNYDRKETLKKFNEMIEGYEHKEEAMKFLIDNLPDKLEYKD